MQKVIASIDREALRYNFRVIKSHVPESKIIAVVKANAYGHGLLEVAKTLSDADAYAVARIEEALELRSGGIVKPIILLEGLFNPEDVQVVSASNLETAVGSWEQLEWIEKAHLQSPVKVWMALNTGMHRLGLNEDEAEEFYSRLMKSENVVKPIGLISHLSCADDLSSDYTKKQIEVFRRFASAHECHTALANSAGILSWPESHTDYVRPGIILYGVSPYDGKTGEDLGLKPVMTLKSNLIAVRKVRKGDKVGYGATWTASRDTRLGIVAMGYGDGYPRQAPNGTPVLINGRIAGTAGHVCMDMMAIDLGPDSTDRVGDEVILWGRGLPVEKISELVGTIPYELILRLTDRVVKEYV